MEPIHIILAAVFISILFNGPLKRLGIPTVIGYILTGILISILFSLHDAATGTLTHVAELGIVFLMFTIGLEFSFRDLVAMKREVLLFGSLQLGLTSLAAGMTAYWLGIDAKGAIIIGLALGLSSTAIVLKTLNESGKVRTPFGKKAVGILIFQDLAVIPILLMVSIFGSQSSDLSALLTTLAMDALLVGAILFLIGRYLLNPLLAWITHTDSSEIFLATVLFLVIGSAELAHLFGFTYSLGAFVAGMLLAETKYKYQIESELIPFRDILMGLFFVTVGMQINLAAIGANIGWILLIFLAVSVLKFGTIFFFLKFFTQLRIALKTAFSLMQVGEFALAIFSLSLGHNLLSGEVAQILFGVVVLSMVVSVFVLANLAKIADWICPEPSAVPVQSAGFSDHVIVCGYGPMGHDVVDNLRELGIAYIILEHDIHSVQTGQQRGEPIFFANAANPEILEAFDAAAAAAVIVAVGNDRHLRLICEALNRVSDHPNVVIKAANGGEKTMLEDLHIDHVVVQSEVMADLLVKEAMQCRIR